MRDALKLLDRAGGEERALAAAAALQHPAPDVQLRALELIAKWTGGRPGEDVRAELLAYAEIVAPTTRGAFDALTGAPAVTAAEPADLAALEARAAALPASMRAALGINAALAGRLDELPPLRRPGSRSSALRWHRSRTSTRSPTCSGGRSSSARRTRTWSARSTASPALCHSRAPFERELKPLLARLGDLRWPSPLMRAFAAWATGRVPRTSAVWEDAQSWSWRFLEARVTEVAERAAKLRPAPLLAAPTHEGYLIEPAALVARAATLDGEPGRFDLVQALHRLAPEGRAAALAAAADLPGDAGEAIRYALGGPRPRSR